MTAKMNSVVLCTSGMTGEDGMMTTVISRSDSSAKDVSQSDVCVTEYVSESIA